MQVLITGITGRIGTQLALALLRDGHTVRGLAWPKDPRADQLEALAVDYGSSRIELIEGTIASDDYVARACAKADVIYHLGGDLKGGGPFTSSEYFEINLRYTFHMLESAERNPNLQHFFFASTDNVYNKYPIEGLIEPIREDMMQIEPEGWGWYPLSKAMGEQMCRAYFHRCGLPVTIFRFCLVWGVGEVLEWPQWRLRYWIERVRDASQSENAPPEQREVAHRTLRNLHAMWSGYEPLILPRDAAGHPFKKHCADVRDIVQGLTRALGRKEVIGETIQLAGPRPFTWHDIVPRLSRILNTHSVEATVAGIPPTQYEFDLSKAKRLLDFEPEYDIQRTVDEEEAARSGGTR